MLYNTILIQINLIFLNILLGLWVLFFLAYKPISLLIEGLDGTR